MNHQEVCGHYWWQKPLGKLERSVTNKSTGKTWIICHKDHLENLKELSQTYNRSRDFNHCNTACITSLVTTETTTAKVVLNSLQNAWFKMKKIYYRWSEKRHTFSLATVANSGLCHNGDRNTEVQISSLVAVIKVIRTLDWLFYITCLGMNHSWFNVGIPVKY